MADVTRWRYGDLNRVEMPVEGPTVIEIGDLVWWDGGELLPMAAFRAGLRPIRHVFVGVAMGRSKPGDTDPVPVATTGVFEYPTPCRSWSVGRRAAPLFAGSGYQSQAVFRTAIPQLAIGVAASLSGLSRGVILVDIVSAHNIDEWQRIVGALA